MNDFALALAFAPLAPWLLLQGRRVRRDTPRLPPAGGPTCGVAAAAGSSREPLRIVTIGESTVAGVGAARHAEALTGQLAAHLAQRSGRAVHWQACGLSGATVRQAHLALLPVIAATPADLIVLAFGVNDVLEHTSPRRYAARLVELIEAVRARVGPAPVLVSAAPPMARFPSLPKPLATYLGARAALLDGAARRIRLADLVHVTPTVHVEPAMFAGDGFHPSPAGYAIWAETLAVAALLRGFTSR